MELLADNVVFEFEGGDSGLNFHGNCPKCGERIHVADYGWWDTTCKCGYRWDLDVRIVAEVEE